MNLIYWKRKLCVLIAMLCFSVLTSPSITLAQNCACEEYIYVNDVDQDLVHKFLVDPTTGALTEIGNPWLDNILNPHGAVYDINGRLYIGEKESSSPDTPSRLIKLTCDGEQVDVLFDNNFDGGDLNNFVSRGNIIYVNGRFNHYIKAYDVCQETFIGTIDYAPGDYNWELFEGSDGFMYTIDGMEEDLQIFRVPYDTSLYDGTLVLAPFLVTSLSISNRSRYWGMVQDPTGNWYVVVEERNDSDDHIQEIVYKLDPNGVVLDSLIDDNNDATGFWEARGIQYSETTGFLYIASKEDDCVAVIDAATMAYLPAISVPGGGGKALSIVKECCPTPGNLVIDTTLCVGPLDEPIFLQDLLNCNGTICEGVWNEDGGNTGLTYNQCDNTVTIDAPDACGSFTLGSDGVGNNPRCGVFEVTVNIEVRLITSHTIAGGDTVCTGGIPNTLTSATAIASGTLAYQWEQNVSSCNNAFSPIAGATNDTYTPPALTETTYYRLVATVGGDCSSGSCSSVSNCVPIVVTDTCMATSSYDVELIKTVDNDLPNINDTITFTLIVNNNGDAVTSAMVTDALPTGLTYANDYNASVGTFDGTIWTIGDLAIGVSENIDMAVVVVGEGVHNNVATVAINETETDMTNNEDRVCVSAPIEICDDGSQSIDATAFDVNGDGTTTYQWYVSTDNGVNYMPIDAGDGGTAQTYNIIQSGYYTYAVNGADLGNCGNQLCCPIIVEITTCAVCPPKNCIPIQINKIN